MKGTGVQKLSQKILLSFVSLLFLTMLWGFNNATITVNLEIHLRYFVEYFEFKFNFVCLHHIYGITVMPTDLAGVKTLTAFPSEASAAVVT